jgi:hypothetical protein
MGFYCLYNTLFAQTQQRMDYTLWNKGENATMMVFSNTAYIRSDADIASPVLDSLSIGDTVVVIEQTKYFTAVRNIYAPWAQIKYVKNKSSQTGYIWMGLLAISFEKNDQNTFLYGVERMEQTAPEDEYTSGLRYNIQLKVLSEKKLVAMKEWKLKDEESMSYSEMKLLGNPKLQNVQEVVRVMFGGEACGIPSNYYYEGFTGTVFLDLPGKMNVGDAGVFYHEETLLFPGETGGQSDKIIRLTKEEEVLEEETQKKKAKVKRSSKREVYNWDGHKAILQKK